MASTAAPSPHVSAALYVGDLDKEVTEAQLYELFNQVGPVASIRVCRDAVTRRSLGYSYVNFNNSTDAERAIEALNYQVVNGRPMRIMWSHRDPSTRRSGVGNIFIKNLDKSIDHKALYDTFSAFGPILSCKVATDPSGQSKGYGFVQFEQDESAQAAIDRVNGMLLKDKQVFVGPFVRRQERQQPGGEGQSFSNVYVKNLPDDITEDDLKNNFGEFGEISSCVVMRDADGKAKGFGFVNFERADDAARAVDALNGKKIGEKEWYVGRAQRKSEREAELREKFEAEKKEKIEKYQGVNLYLKNLEESTDEEKLRELFAEYGTVTSCKLLREPSGTSKGAGFIAFSTPEEASRAVTEMNGKMVGSKPIYVALAQRKEERKARLQAQFNQQRAFAGSRPGMPMQMAAAAATGPPMPSSVPLFIPGAPGLAAAQQMFYGQPGAPGLLPAQAGYPYQQQMMGAVRPGLPGQMQPNYFVPFMARPGGPPPPAGINMRGVASGAGARRAGAAASAGGGGYPHGDVYAQQQQQQQQQAQPQQVGPPPPAALPQPSGGIPIAALASALASATPEQRRAMLGEQLYPLVDQLEHDHAGKVTGMLLEMDQAEVLHLLESPDALKTKVDEAMEVLRMASAGAGGAADIAAAQQLGALSLNESG